MTCRQCNDLKIIWVDISETNCPSCSSLKSQYEQLYKQFENTRSGNTFDSWLKEEGIYDEVEERVNERNKSKKV